MKIICGTLILFIIIILYILGVFYSTQHAKEKIEKEFSHYFLGLKDRHGFTSEEVDIEMKEFMRVLRVFH